MPLPQSISEQTFEYDGKEYVLPLVDLNGISHIIAIGGIPLSDTDLECAIKKWCGDIGAACLGLMCTGHVAPGEGNIRPLVYVPKLGTCFWENSCASGTTAAAAYMYSNGMIEGGYSFREPGGELSVKRADDGSIILSGTVRL